MKKLIAMLLVLTMVLSFAACAKKDAQRHSKFRQNLLHSCDAGPETAGEV